MTILAPEPEGRISDTEVFGGVNTLNEARCSCGGVGELIGSEGGHNFYACFQCGKKFETSQDAWVGTHGENNPSGAQVPAEQEIPIQEV